MKGLHFGVFYDSSFKVFTLKKVKKTLWTMLSVDLVLKLIIFYEKCVFEFVEMSKHFISGLDTDKDKSTNIN